MSITRQKRSPVQLALMWGGGLAAILIFAALMGFDQFFETLLLGLPQGSIIALIAVGYSMVYGIILLINFAHGEVFMLSSYLVLMFLWLPEDFPVRIPGQPLFVPIIVALLLAAAFFITFNTFGATSTALRRRTPRWSVGAVCGLIVGYLAYRSFVAPGWVAAFGGVVTAGLGTYVAVLVMRAMDVKAGPWPRAGIAVAIGLFLGLPFWWLFRDNIFISGIVVSLALTATIGVTLDTLAYKPLRTAPRLIPLITAIGMSIVFQSVAQVVWGAEPFTYPDKSLPELFRPPQFMTDDGEFITTMYLYEMPLTQQIDLGHAIVMKNPFRFGAGELTEDMLIRIPIIDVIIIVLGVLVMVGLNLLIYKTKLGKSMRACSEDKTTARLVGVNVDAVVAATFVLGSAMAALVSPLWVIKYANVEPTMGLIVGVLAFASAVLGGIGDIRGAMIGGLAIGLIYNFVPALENIDSWAFVQRWEWMSEETAFYIYDNYLQGLTQWRLGVAYAFMILVIIIKPTGLFGETTAKRA